MNRKLLISFAAVLVAGLLSPLFAQEDGVFSSGSDGSDGALSPTEDTVILVDKPVYNYTSVNIPSGVIVTFAKTGNNYPVVWRSQGDIVIDGAVNLDGSAAVESAAGRGGPGGWNGGDGALNFTSNPDITQHSQPGQGPGGAPSVDNDNNGSGGGYSTQGGQGQGGKIGLIYGNAFGIPLLGGSGGSGAGYWSNLLSGGGGGGGGGAFFASSSTRITVNGTVSAKGGNGTRVGNAYGGGGGSGGMVKLASNYITLGATGSLRADGGSTAFGAGGGANGRIRIEAFDYTISGSAVISPTANTGPPVAFDLPEDYPGLRITSINGQAITNPTGEPGLPDLTLADSGAVPVVVTGQNIPLGTVVKLYLHPTDAPTQTYDASALAGTFESSTGGVDVIFPPGVTQLVAASSFTPGRSMQTDDGQAVAKVEVQTDMTGAQTVTLITESGERVVDSTNN
ncbi:hypothetical protein HZA57_08645 [Candidatus Poribacteria bacterium]|nr:hypothetical protein [Candidatus Poribacteria bacterium]